MQLLLSFIRKPVQAESFNRKILFWINSNVVNINMIVFYVVKFHFQGIVISDWRD